MFRRGMTRHRGMTRIYIYILTVYILTISIQRYDSPGLSKALRFWQVINSSAVKPRISPRGLIKFSASEGGGLFEGGLIRGGGLLIFLENFLKTCQNNGVCKQF